MSSLHNGVDCSNPPALPLSSRPSFPSSGDLLEETLEVWNACGVNGSISRCQFQGSWECPLNYAFSMSHNVCIGSELIFDGLYPSLDDAAIVYGKFYTFFVILTVIANVFVVLVLSRKNMASQTNTLLLYMATADLFVAIVPFPFMFLFFMLESYKQPSTVQASWCWLYHFTVDTLPPICHNIAIWLTVFLAAHRFLFITYPDAAQRWCSLANVRRASVAVVVVSVLAGAQKLVLYQSFRPYTPDDTFACLNETEPAFVPRNIFGCIADRTPVFYSITENVFFTTYFTVRILFFILLPSLLLIILNVLLISAIRQASLRRKRLLKQSRRQAEAQRQSASTSTMLVCIVTIFLIVNLPQGIILTLFTLNVVVLGDQGIQLDPNTTFWLFSIDNLLILATYPVNFAIYCSMSAQFRDTFKRLFCPNLPTAPTFDRTTSVQSHNHTAQTIIRNGTTNNATAVTAVLNGKSSCQINGSETTKLL